ncbi:murein L,D-transpeptidase catalytic domain-containing protein [Kaistella jeonii]|uniref:Peptidase n=1 Tax=Kaistella jeonii TaxID=266749 RepID=A0A0C1FJ84_9FLAO|nr:murein L,D-transpeptidase catalytic domain family protein [Kaistella jeonii]KIA87974.1 hypothetical protein OA86_13070 [Kaistella jeonii]SFC08015.1 L,D-transpeptidase catalytic domain [Kaistella jeonii]VEI95150.1 Uncharacterised protein [Kaistella jeonii]
MKKILLVISFLLFCGISAQSISSAKISEVKNFIKGKNYNQDLAIFIDFKIPSSKFRFFIYDLKKERIVEKAIVSHGSGSVIKNSNSLRFSNIENSYQSSVGKYEIGNSYLGTFGKSYRLKGLDRTNSNAVKRAIVMHSFPCIKNEESSEPACLSLGCPMISKEFFRTAEKYIDNSKKPLILYAFY